jgi:hypothetical protein
MLTKRQITVLHLFNEKAEKLETITFSRLLMTTGIKATINFEGNPPGKFDFGELNKEHIDAFVLTARYFIQNNERISFKNIANIYSSLKPSDQLRIKFDKVRAILNTSLDTNSIGIPEPLTYRHILFTVIYGELAHSNTSKRAEYKRWNQKIFRAGFIFIEFLRALNILFVAINEIRKINDEVIKRDQAQPAR